MSIILESGPSTDSDCGESREKTPNIGVPGAE